MTYEGGFTSTPTTPNKILRFDTACHAWNQPKEIESFKSLFARTRQNETTGDWTANLLTDWSTIPFPPYHEDESSTSLVSAPETKKWIINAKSTNFESPKRSPYTLHSADYLRQKTESAKVGAHFIENFNMLSLSIVKPGNSDLSGAMSALSNEIWMDILDFVSSPSDILSLCRSCTFFYRLAIPKLYHFIPFRMPYYPGEEPRRSLQYGIPFNEFADPIYRKLPSKFPKKWQMARYIRRIVISRWDGPEEPRPRALPEYIRPTLTTYDLWKGHNGTNCLQLWVGKEHGGQPPINVNAALAQLLRTQLRNLRGFYFLPRPLYSGPAPSIATILSRGYISPHSIPFVTEDVLAALKSLQYLRELAIDFERCDPLLYERVRGAEHSPSLPKFTNYDPEKDGLVGFKNLRYLEMRGVGCDARFTEIARVISDCIASGSLGRFNFTVEKWWYYLVEHFELNENKGLWEWCQEIWSRCFNVAEEKRILRPELPLLNILVDIHFQHAQWTFSTSVDYTCRSECVRSLHIHSGLILPHTVILLKKLSGMDLPNLQILCLKCFLADVRHFLKTSPGLKELYIINPASRERLLARGAGQQKQRQVAFDESKIPPKIVPTNWIMDTICKRHLRTLLVLVIDEMITIPHSREHSSINSLELWKNRGGNLKELGLKLWGPWDRVADFITCFPSLQCFHYFNSPTLYHVTSIPTAPISFQVTAPESFYNTPYFCDAANTAAKIANTWSQKLISGRTDQKNIAQENPEATRWIAIGPWDIRKDFESRWKWNEDQAKEYLNWKIRPEYYGAMAGNPEKPWCEVSSMWKTLRMYLK